MLLRRSRSRSLSWAQRLFGIAARAAEVVVEGGTLGQADPQVVEAPQARWSPASDAIAYGKATSPHEAINVVRLDRTRLTITFPDEEGVMARMVAWDRPDRLTYRSTDWKFVATTALDGIRGEVLFDFRETDDPPWVGAVPWGSPWLVADGQRLSWWEERDSQTRLMAADNDRRVRARFCIDRTTGQFAVGQE